MNDLRVGTCSWKYPSWQGLVYSSREPENYLREYAGQYSTVEVDQWFWSLGKAGTALPKRETVAEYDMATPADFRFTVKCPNALTLTHHHGKKGEPLQTNPRFLDEGFFNSFLESLAALVPKIGLFIFQFEYLNRDKMESRGAFMERLGRFLERLPADLPYAVELRNPKWIDATWFQLLREHSVAPVLLQGYWMDDVARTIDAHENRIGDTLCIRLHGEDREGMEERTGADWSRVVRPKDQELAAIMGSVRRLLTNDRKVFLNVNNHYEGSAPLTIEKIQQLGIRG
jgi:uncharacterized protein YecE (DUF72 family)